MSQICFYFDEDAGKRSLIDSLRQSKVDVLTTVEANNLQQTDEEQLYTKRLFSRTDSRAISLSW